MAVVRTLVCKRIRERTNYRKSEPVLMIGTNQKLLGTELGLESESGVLKKTLIDMIDCKLRAKSC